MAVTQLNNIIYISHESRYNQTCEKITKVNGRVYSLHGLYLGITFLRKIIMYGLYLQGGLYSEAAFNTGLTVCLA